MVKDFDGITALITGGASGIGATTAALLHDRGANVAILDRALEGVDPRFFSVSCDITDAVGVEQAVGAVAAEFGGIDILIKVAGIGAVGDITVNDDAEWHRVFDVNVVGIARVSRAALPYLRQSKFAAIVSTCSVAATVGLPDRALYSASKGAVAALTRAMAADHIRENVRVNAVMPGTADTPWVARLLEATDDAAAAVASLRARQPMGRLVTPKRGRSRHRISVQSGCRVDDRYLALGRWWTGRPPSRAPGQIPGQRQRRSRLYDVTKERSAGEGVLHESDQRVSRTVNFNRRLRSVLHLGAWRPCCYTSGLFRLDHGRS